MTLVGLESLSKGTVVMLLIVFKGLVSTPLRGWGRGNVASANKRYEIPF